MQPATQILMNYEEKVASIGFALREFLLSKLPDIIEQPDVAANMIAYCYGPGYKDVICNIIPSKKGIKLGFYKGATLPDPEGLLTGSGKVHRYVEIKTIDAIGRPGVLQLLNEALKAYKARRT